MDYFNTFRAVNKGETILAKTEEIVQALKASPYCRLLALKKEGDKELVEVELEIQLPQYPKYSIQRKEPVGIVITKGDLSYPEVFSLRPDFPYQLPHLNLRDFEYPKSLCIYAQPYDELKITWTGHKFIEDVRRWFQLNAVGQLHQPDQPLEPLLGFDEGVMFFLDGAWNGEPLAVTTLNTVDGKPYLVGYPQNMSGTESLKKELLEVSLLKGEKPLLHGVVTHTPKNLATLDAFLQKVGINMRKVIKEVIKRIEALDKPATKLQHRLLLLISLPKLRALSGDTFYEYYCFTTKQTIQEIGVLFNLWSVYQNKVGAVIGRNFDEMALEKVGISMLRPQLLLHPELARLLNGVEDYPEQDPRIMAIGMGAIGSQVFLNMAKSGYGKWVLVDDDILLPHNLSRHAAPAYGVARYKAEVMSEEAKNLLNRSDFSQAQNQNVLHPNNPIVLNELIKQAMTIVDFSASVAVARNLGSDVRFAQKRKISAFLNPKGDSLVIMAQDKELKMGFDFLEMQYYRELINNKSLENHLQIPEIDGFRYSNSCRDITGRISQDNVATLAGIGSAYLKKQITSTPAEINIWTINEDTSVSRLAVPISQSTAIKLNGWELVIDEDIKQKLFTHRKSRLPNETGGILLGAYDIPAKKIFIVDSILSPKDSHEYPNAYIRGVEGVELLLKNVEKQTAGMVQYVGEWHSHPEGASLSPSGDDGKLFAWLENHMGKEGLPGLMLIIGGDEFNIIITQVTE